MSSPISNQTSQFQDFATQQKWQTFNEESATLDERLKMMENDIGLIVAKTESLQKSVKSLNGVSNAAIVVSASSLALYILSYGLRYAIRHY